MSFGVVAAGAIAIGTTAYSSHQAGKAADAQARQTKKAGKWMERAATEAVGYIQEQRDANRMALMPYIQAGMGLPAQMENQFVQTGQQAYGRLADINGLNGAEAQRAAYQSFQESPGSQYFQQQQEQALLRNSAAIGGLGGGQVRMALQDQAMQNANTNFNQYYNNLASLATTGGNFASNLSARGYEAATNTASMAQQDAYNLANAINTMGTNQANVQTRLGAIQADALLARGQQTSNLVGQLGGLAANYFTSPQNQLNMGVNNMLANNKGIF